MGLHQGSTVERQFTFKPSIARQPSSTPAEYARFYRPGALAGVEFFQGRFTRHSFARHAHPNHYCIALVLEGTLLLETRSGHHVMTAGSGIVFEPGVAHAGASPPGASFACRVLYCSPSHISAVTPCVPHFADIPFRNAQLSKLLVELHDLVASGQAGAFTNLFWSALRTLFDTAAIAPAAPQVHPAVAKSIGLLRRGDLPLAETSLTSLAHHVALHPVYLSRLFTRATGMPPVAYLRSVRLQEAKNRLGIGESLSHLAVDLGFTDQSHFSREFKRSFGLTPGVYARQLS